MEPFSKSSSVSTIIHRQGRSSAAGKFSPSFGVRHGLIKDPNWPPAEFPNEGSACARRFRRVEAEFQVALRGEEVAVRGDVSEGGAMFLLDRAVALKVVDVIVAGKFARAEVLSTSQRGSLVAHHCRFMDSEESRPVWEAIASS